LKGKGKNIKVFQMVGEQIAGNAETLSHIRP
jgi:hypothetical protein